MHARMHQDDVSVYHIKNTGAATHKSSGVLHSGHTVFANYPVTVTRHDKIDELRESEDETNEHVSLKKCVELNKYLNSIYCTSAPLHLLGFTARNHHPYKHFAYFSSGRRYIIFRVIRL